MNFVRRMQSLVPFLPHPYRGTYELCNVCKSAEYVVLCDYDRRWKPLQTVACTGCGLIRTNPMPTAAELARFYAYVYRREQFASKAPPRFHIVRRGREAQTRLVVLAPAIKPGVRILDVGSGSGEFLAAAQARGCEVLGIDPGASFSAYARTQYNVEIVTAPWQEANLPDNSFDIVTCFHVLEHMREPLDALRQMARWLKPDGILHIAVPNMLPNASPSFERFHFDHVHGFIPETLVRAAQACGLDVDARFRSTGTNIVFRRTDVVQKIEPNPVTAAHLVSMYPQASIASFILLGAWFRGIGRKTLRDVRDSLAAGA